MRKISEKTVFIYDKSNNPSVIYDSETAKDNDGKWSLFLDWMGSIVISFIAIFLVFSFVFRPVSVSGRSMFPTLNDKDWLLVNHINYVPKYGDIVVVTQPNALNEPVIKRVIAVGGDTVDIDFDRGVVIVNGRELDEPYTYTPTNNSFDVSFPLTVKEGFVFVMGDNRNNSLDSRSTIIGQIDERYLLGKVVARVFPMKKIDNKTDFGSE